jgi:hypothetical protein
MTTIIFQTYLNTSETDYSILSVLPPELTNMVGEYLIETTPMGLLVNGLKHGNWEELWSNGFTKSMCTYVYGVQNGIYQRWHPNGKLQIEKLYIKGSMVHAKWNFLIPNKLFT